MADSGMADIDLAPIDPAPINLADIETTAAETGTGEPAGRPSAQGWTARIVAWLRDLVAADEPAAASLSEGEADDLRDPDMDRRFAAFMTSPLY